MRLALVVLVGCAAGPQVRDGVSTTTYADGTKHASGRYVAGKRDGAWREWHENGKLWLEGAYRNGVRVGPWVEYDYTGAKMFEATYVDGHIEGAWKSYGFGGVERASGTSVAGKLEGKVVVRMRDGGRYEETWRANKRDGTITGYDKDGKVIETIEFRGGVPVVPDAK